MVNNPAAPTAMPAARATMLFRAADPFPRRYARAQADRRKQTAVTTLIADHCGLMPVKNGMPSIHPMNVITAMKKTTVTMSRLMVRAVIGKIVMRRFRFIVSLSFVLPAIIVPAATRLPFRPAGHSGFFNINPGDISLAWNDVNAGCRIQGLSLNEEHSIFNL